MQLQHPEIKARQFEIVKIVLWTGRGVKPIYALEEIILRSIWKYFRLTIIFN